MCSYTERIAASIEQYSFREALNEMMNLSRLGNKYLTDNEPWKVFKTDPERVKTVLNVSLQIAAHLCVLCQPFLPFTATRLRRILNMEELAWDKACESSLLPDNHALNPAEFLFEKIEDEAIRQQIDKLQATKEANAKNAAIEYEAQKSPVSFDDFGKIDLRVAQITAAEKVAKTKKLLKLTLITGLDTRTVVSGIAEYYEPEAIVGKKVCLLANLEPKNLKGIESHGMILMSENPDGKLCFVEPVADAEPGMQIR